MNTAPMAVALDSEFRASIATFGAFEGVCAFIELHGESAILAREVLSAIVAIETTDRIQHAQLMQALRRKKLKMQVASAIRGLLVEEKAKSLGEPPRFSRRPFRLSLKRRF